MDAATVLDLVAKGLEVLPTLIDAGINIEQRVVKLTQIAKGGAAGTLTDAEIAQYRADLDADMDEFNKPME